MKLHTIIVLTILLSTDAVAQKTVIDTGKKFISLLFTKNYSKAVELVDASVTDQMNEKALEKIETGLITSLGEFIKPVSYRQDSGSEYKIIYYYCKFTKSNMDLKLVFNDNSKVVGFYVFEHKKKDNGYVSINE
jgi:hypothetical protein